MAVTDQPSSIQMGWIDPREEPTVQQVPFRPDLYQPIDFEKIELIYDEPSDTLYLMLFGRERPSAVVDGIDDFLFLVDPGTGQLLGVQIEGFLAHAAVENPQLLDALEIAELLGLTRAQARRERHRILGYRGRFAAWVQQRAWLIKLRTTSRRRALVAQLFHDNPFGLPLGSTAPSG